MAMNNPNSQPNFDGVGDPTGFVQALKDRLASASGQPKPKPVAHNPMKFKKPHGTQGGKKS